MSSHRTDREQQLSPISPQARRRRKILARGAPLAALAVAAFVAGLVVAGGSSARDAVDRFGAAWERGDYDAMYTELSADAQAEISREQFAELYASATRTATLRELTVGESRGPLTQDGTEQVALPFTYRTDSFGTVSGELGVPVADGAIAWRPRLVFPGLRDGEQLERRTMAPERAPILAADGSPLANGPAEARVAHGAGGIVTGELGAPGAERAREMRRQGFPPETPAGNSGLELAFDGLLAGIPGGELLAVGEQGERVLASAEPTPGRPLRTTIDPQLQEEAAAALGGLFGGVAVLDARKGDVKALAGIAFSAPQPPGSTMKIITAAAALEEGLTRIDQQYPVLTSVPVGGREIENSEEGACGGDLVASFAKSCNTVFAPLGAELGAERLVAAAEAFGFNSPPTLYNDDALAAIQPPASTIPADLESALEVGVSAIGQGEVLATPLQFASVAQTIANDGVRSATSIVKAPRLRSDFNRQRVVSSEVARQVRRMMVEVVSSGTAQAAQLPDAVVAGKTGTAELGPKPDQEIDPEDPEAEPEQELDAWFAAFAPAKRPKLAIAVMIVNAEGDGGVVAAPIAARVLAAGL